MSYVAYWKIDGRTWGCRKKCVAAVYVVEGKLLGCVLE